jgi:hypothetical protein
MRPEQYLGMFATEKRQYNIVEENNLKSYLKKYWFEELDKKSFYREIYFLYSEEIEKELKEISETQGFPDFSPLSLLYGKLSPIRGAEVSIDELIKAAVILIGNKVKEELAQERLRSCSR